MAKGTHDYAADPRNDTILINVNGTMTPRAEATVSVFDSGFMLGDGVWEGLRQHRGRIAFLEAHLDRLYEGAKAIAMDVGLTREELTQRIDETIAANAMRDEEGVHIRLMVTRGVRSTPYQDPRVVISAATIVIIPEYKAPLPSTIETGIRLFTVHVRRGDPAVQDQKLNSHSKLNCITACIQATQAGADEALMLDPHGFVATCNSTHFFIVRKGEVWTSSGDYCLGGITRSAVIQVCREADIPVFEKNFSLTDVYGADEA
ncbi:MAG: aminotransferase class IV, partial [Pseudomonadota bacterium]